MLKVKKTKILGSLCILMLMIAAASGFAQSVEPEPDKALLARFEAVCKEIGNIKGSYTLGGVMSVDDKANAGNKMQNVQFLFCKQGDDFYYQLGTTATLNGQGVYLYINHQTKRVIVSQQKQTIYDMGFKQFSDMAANIASEHYKLVSKITGDEQTISLINEQHISCKQYSVSFNRHNMKIRRLYMRLSNPVDPLRTDNEKIVDVSISKWDSTADLSKYLSKNRVIKNINGGWKTVNEFKNYQLIKM